MSSKARKGLIRMTKLNVNIFKSALFLQIFGMCLTYAQEYKQNPMETLAEFEVIHNSKLAADISSGKIHNNPMDIGYLEIPTEIVDTINGLNSEEFKAIFEFEKIEGGVRKKYVRWILHPQGGVFNEQIIKILLSKQIKPIIKHGYFTGYYTASRSMVLIPNKNPNHQYFTIKVSSASQAGPFSGVRPVFAEEAHATIDISDQIERTKKTIRTGTLDVLPTPLAYTLNNLGEAHGLGMIVRKFDFKKDEVLIPGFSVLNEKLGQMIALQNNSDPAKFWVENYLLPVARANAELWLNFGLTQFSPHSQQYLLRFKYDSKGVLRPLINQPGYVSLRDPGDSTPDYEVLKMMSIIPSDLANAHFEEIKYRDPFAPKLVDPIRNDVLVLFGPFHGTPIPSWLESLTQKQKTEIESQYMLEYLKRVSEITKVNLKSLQRIAFKEGSFFAKNQRNYMGISIPTKNQLFEYRNNNLISKSSLCVKHY